MAAGVGALHRPEEVSGFEAERGGAYRSYMA